MQNQSSPNSPAIQWNIEAETVQHFKCSARHINKLIRRRILSFVKIRRFVRFDINACDQAMKNYQTKSLFD